MDDGFSFWATDGASVSTTADGYRFALLDWKPGGYRLAQLDDYANLPRRRFPSKAPLTLGLRARASGDSLPGTWGFGLWNDPFGLSLGFGGSPWRLPSLPNAIWFFHASAENYLSFRDDKPGNGFLAQAFRSPAFPLRRLAKVGLALPFARQRARQWMSRIVEEDGVRLGIDVTQWHAYRFEWSPARSAFWVDEALVLETPVTPRPPLGLIIWLDNQYAFWRPDGKFGWGVVEGVEGWIEVEEIVLRSA